MMATPTDHGWFGPAFLLVAAVTALRWGLLAFNGTDLFVDESQYWLWGQEFAFGYYSKPPLIAWVIGAVTAVLGESPFAVRMPGAAFHGATALILAALAARLHGRVVAVWVAAAYVTLPMVGVGGLLMSTDTIMAPFFAAALLYHRRVIDGGHARDAVLAGVMVGLACLAKYAGVYFLVGVGLAALWRRDLRMSWRNAGLMGAAFLLVMSPNLIWNLQNGLTTLSHTADNIGWVRQEDKLSGLNLAGLAEFLAAQFGVMGPGLFAALLYSFTRRGAALGVFVLPALLVVTTQALMDRAYANWAASAYFAGTIMAVAVLSPRLRIWAVGVNAALCLTLAVLTTQPQFEWNGKPLLSRYLGRVAMSRQVLAIADKNGGVPIYTNSRDLLADLFYTGREAGLTFYAPAPQGRPMNHYEQRYPLPAGLTGPLLWVTTAAPDCAGTPFALDGTGTFAGDGFAAYLTTAECARGQ